jgi:hypothetical protein
VRAAIYDSTPRTSRAVSFRFLSRICNMQW